MHGEGVHDQKVDFFILIGLTRMSVFFRKLCSHIKRLPAKASPATPIRPLHRYVDAGHFQETSRRDRQIGPDGMTTMISMV
jgi:hypothetical protein